jgi:hypothetical protein
MLHALFIERDPNLQGNFFTMKRTVVEEMWQTILEPAGVAVLTGSAMYSINSQVKRPCASKDDWRNSPNYIGLDQDLRPIFVSGIMRFYLMMNFLPFGISERADENKVALISESVSEKIRQRDISALLNYRQQAPDAVRAHPSDEHLLPLYVALGAAGNAPRIDRFHTGISDYVLAMDAYAFHPLH